MGQPSNAQEHIADKLVTFESLFEPVRLSIVDPSQLETAGVGHLEPSLIDETQVHEDAAVFFLKDGQFALKKGFVWA